MGKDAVREPARDTPVHGEYEVVVLGGGPAGIAAATSAAGAGRRTLLVERYGFLGGMGTAAGVTNFCGLHANIHGEIRRVVHGVADELLDRIDRLGGLNEPHVVLGRTMAQAYDTAAYKCAADDLLTSRGAQLLFHALAAGVVVGEGGAIEALLVETKSGRRAVRGQVFVDCSGDGDLAAWAGAPFEVGDGAGNMLYPTMMFRVNGVDPEAAGDAWRTIPERMAEAERAGRRRFPRKGAIVRPQRHPTEWRVNVTQLKTADGRAVNGIDADELSAAEAQGRRQALEYFGFLKDEVPGFAASYIVEIPPQLGIRETRRVTGRRGDLLRELCRQHRRQRVAAREARCRRRGMGLARHPGVARLQPATLPHAAAPRRAEPARGGPLRVHGPRGAVGRARERRLLRHGPGGRHGGAPRPGNRSGASGHRRRCLAGAA